MLDELGLTTAAICWKQLIKSPEYGNYTPKQILLEILTPQYIQAMNDRYMTNLKFSKLIDKSAKIEDLKTGNGRRYNDETVKQILDFSFVPSGFNVGIYGKTGAGKSYFMSALCHEACRQNYRCQYIDYYALMDELLRLSLSDMVKYTKKIKYYAHLKILFIDDFCSSRYSEDAMKILYHLVKLRTDFKNPTVFNSQHDPSEWGSKLSDNPDCYGKLDGIRRRLTTGFTIEIVKVENENA